MSDQKVKLAMVNDEVVVLATSPGSMTLTISTMTNMSIEALVRQNLSAGNLQTALNIVMETGRGRRQLREYQLKLSDYSDMEMLEDFLEQNNVSAKALI